MISDLELAEKLIDEINEMHSANEIAELLRANGVKAVRSRSMYCAISEYVKGRSGCITSTDKFLKGSIRSWNGDGNSILKINSLAVNEFVRNFDSGVYPFLECNINELGHIDNE